MTDAEIDLNGVTKVSRSKLINYPSYTEQVLMVQHGWQQNKNVVWDKEVKIETKIRGEG